MIQKILILLVLLTSCAKEASSEKPKKPLVLVSIAPYKFLVNKIAEDALDVETIIPPRSNPHVYEPTSKQVATLHRSDIWFRIEEPFERKLLPILSKDLEVHDLVLGMELDHEDRHVWLSPKILKIQAQKIAKVLQNRYPAHSEKFQKNLIGFEKELDAVDVEIGALLAPLKARSLIVSHPAFGYFCKDYGLEQISIEQEGKDPRPRHVEKILEMTKEKMPALALALPQHNNKGVQLVAGEMKLPVRLIDPYAENSLKTMLSLARLIADPNSGAP